jgi:hypothetical protein
LAASRLRSDWTHPFAGGEKDCYSTIITNERLDPLKTGMRGTITLALWMVVGTVLGRDNPKTAGTDSN